MKQWQMRYTPETSRLVSKLSPENKRQIKKALDGLRTNPYTGKDLQEELFGFKSFRLKHFRIICTIKEESDSFQIYHIGCRSDVYEQFRRLLTELQKTTTGSK